MISTLNENDIRVLGALMEKEVTTPEYYPMTLNALTNACNQKSNRNPVVSFAQETVVRSLDRLRDDKLVWERTSPGSRVSKYAHQIKDRINLTTAEKAVLTVLFLRGAQTIGEIKGRCERLYEFSSIEAVEITLEGLENREEQPLIKKLPRQPGQKESRYTHLLCGEPEIEEVEYHPKPEAATLSVHEEQKRISELERKIDLLSDQLNELQTQFDSFVKQF